MNRSHAVGIVALAACAPLLAACVASNHPRSVSAAEFVELANLPIGSARDSRFLGVAWHRAYLCVWSVASGEAVCSCALDELPAELAARIRSGENPWPKPHH